VRVLGISAFYHDSAAALVEDGRIVAATRETLLLGSGDDPAVFDESRGAVVVEGGDAEDPHRRGRQKMV